MTGSGAWPARSRPVVRAAPLDAGAWAPFGWLPVPDTDAADGADPIHRLSFADGDPHLNFIAHGYDEVVHEEGAARCDRLFRHRRHTQALVAVDVFGVLVVATPASGLPDVATAEEAAALLRTFLLAPLDCVVLHAGTWHWGPFPVAPGTIRLLNVQARGYLGDNDSVDLAGRAVDVAVDPGLGPGARAGDGTRPAPPVTPRR